MPFDSVKEMSVAAVLEQVAVADEDSTAGDSTRGHRPVDDHHFEDLHRAGKQTPMFLVVAAETEVEEAAVGVDRPHAPYLDLSHGHPPAIRPDVVEDLRLVP
jgi:hypothetical protein